MRTKFIAIVAAIVLMAVGCGNDGGPMQASDSAQTIDLRVVGDIGKTPAPSHAAAAATCEAIHSGDMSVNAGVRQVEFKLPNSNGRDFTCIVP